MRPALIALVFSSEDQFADEVTKKEDNDYGEHERPARRDGDYGTFKWDTAGVIAFHLRFFYTKTCAWSSYRLKFAFLKKAFTELLRFFIGEAGRSSEKSAFSELAVE